MDVQAELANAIKARHRKVYGIETPPPAPEKTKQKEKHTRQPVATNDIGKSSKNKAQKAAAAAIAAKMGKPAQSKPEKKEKKGWKASFSKKGSSGSATSSQSLSEKDKQTVEQYRKMLKRGLPEGAVMHKMQSNGFSKSIVDAVMSKDVAPAVVKQTQSSGSLSQEEEKTAEQYRKMKKMGLPDGAVTHKMIADGISVKIQEAVLAGNSTPTARTTSIPTSSSSRNSGTNTNAGGNVSSLSRQDEATATPYRKMIKTGLPEGAVRHKMTMDGIEMHIQDSVLKGETARNSGNTAANTNVAATSKGAGKISSLSRQDEATATRYRKMIKTGLPEGAVGHKMTMDGVGKHIQDSVLKGEMPAPPANDPSSGDTSSTRSVNPMAAVIASSSKGAGKISSLSRQDEATATPYRKMIKTGLPEGAVRHKMTMDGVEKHIQDSVLKGETPAPPANDPSSGDTSSTRPVNPMAAAIASSGGIGFLKKSRINPLADYQPSKPSNPLAAAIAASGGMGALKKTSIQKQEVESGPSKPSNPLAAAIAASGGMGALKKTSIQKQEVESGRPSNPLAAAIAASGGQGGLKKASVKNNQQSPKPRSSGSSLVDELAAKGFTSGLNSTKQPPKPKSANIAVSSKQKLVYVPPKPKSANIPVSSKQETVYVPPKPKSTNVAVSSKQKPTVYVPLKSKPASITVSSKQIQAVYVPPKSKPASIAVSSKQNQAVCVPPKPKSANVAVQKPVPTPVGKPTQSANAASYWSDNKFASAECGDYQ
ncbi:hypothetical protein FRACYDRAFT_247136 [Fragilariopsis cylindrus CCMP1102]|uniref:Uncharacterized protein n=1 Tax=Fragilariopsis cylindrus CCMP1102 TaxID=635003 RepID=A0A1E7EXQ9_9STRA|nr:hypothetical protein FRACYDRAFT_247136 [Fragilariopsis cylindrus CCMP1102]|eukprot:OEU10594.1 hypothetical protein FRACYDRAFT_247136 [Fragilariopsis cylindrus CCMP1102]